MDARNHFDLEFFRIKLSTGDVGVALIGIGVRAMMFVFVRLFKLIKNLAALPESSTRVKKKSQPFA